MVDEYKPVVIVNGELSELPDNSYITGLEEEVPQRQEVDFVGDTIIYKGWAPLNSLTSDAVWKLQRITITDGDFTFEWADSANYSQTWDNRAAAIYS